MGLQSWPTFRVCHSQNVSSNHWNEVICGKMRLRPYQCRPCMPGGLGNLWCATELYDKTGGTQSVSCLLPKLRCFQRCSAANWGGRGTQHIGRWDVPHGTVRRGLGCMGPDGLRHAMPGFHRSTVCSGGCAAWQRVCVCWMALVLNRLVCVVCSAVRADAAAVMLPLCESSPGLWPLAGAARINGAAWYCGSVQLILGCQ